MKKEIKKLYRGNAEIRDYDVQKCISENKNFTIKYEGDIMTLSAEDLVKKRLNVSKTFESKVGGKNYKLYAYAWNPNEIEL